jgi:hypothetical protein
MPRNLKGGNKAKKSKNSSDPKRNREVAFPESSDDSHVAIITKVCGDSRYMCQIINQNGIQPKVYNANLSKGTKNKYGRGIIIGIDSYVLIAIREFQKEKTDIIFIYKDSEKSILIENNYISSINKSDESNDFDDFFKESENKKSIEIISENELINTVPIENDDEIDFSAI